MRRVVEVLCSRSKTIHQSTNIQRRTHYYHQQRVNLRDGPHIWLILVHSVHMSTAILPIIQLKVKLMCSMLWMALQYPARSDHFIFANSMPNVIHGHQIQNSHGHSYKWVLVQIIDIFFIICCVCISWSEYSISQSDQKDLGDEKVNYQTDSDIWTKHSHEQNESSSTTDEKRDFKSSNSVHRPDSGVEGSVSWMWSDILLSTFSNANFHWK